MAKDSFYACSSWRKLRAYKLSINPFCERCNALAVEVHHIKDRLKYPALSLNIVNLESLCKSCHSTHTNKDKKKEWKIYKVKYE